MGDLGSVQADRTIILRQNNSEIAQQGEIALEIAEIFPAPDPPSFSVAVAVNKGSSCRHALSWACKYEASAGDKITLLFVRPTIKSVPTPMGYHVPLAAASEEAVLNYFQEIDFQNEELRCSLLAICNNFQIQGEFILIESDDLVQTVIMEEILTRGITKIILGSSSRSSFLGKYNPGCCTMPKSSTSDLILESVPEYCAVRVVSKNSKLLYSRDASF